MQFITCQNTLLKLALQHYSNHMKIMTTITSKEHFNLLYSFTDGITISKLTFSVITSSYHFLLPVEYFIPLQCTFYGKVQTTACMWIIGLNVCSSPPTLKSRWFQRNEELSLWVWEVMKPSSEKDFEFKLLLTGKHYLMSWNGKHVLYIISHSVFKKHAKIVLKHCL